MLGNICLRLSSSAHSPLTAGFELRYPRPKGRKIGQKSGRGRRGNFRLFWSATGHFSCAAVAVLACRAFFGFLANYRKNLRRLGEVDSARGNFLAPKQTKKTERTKNKINRFQCTQSRTSTETRALPTRYSTYSAQCKFVYSTRPFQYTNFYGLDRPFKSVAIPRPKLSIEGKKV
jgi:hypothetical protein